MLTGAAESVQFFIMNRETMKNQTRYGSISCVIWKIVYWNLKPTQTRRLTSKSSQQPVPQSGHSLQNGHSVKEGETGIWPLYCRWCVRCSLGSQKVCLKRFLSSNVTTWHLFKVYIDEPLRGSIKVLKRKGHEFKAGRYDLRRERREAKWGRQTL